MKSVASTDNPVYKVIEMAGRGRENLIRYVGPDRQKAFDLADAHNRQLGIPLSRACLVMFGEELLRGPASVIKG